MSEPHRETESTNDVRRRLRPAAWTMWTVSILLAAADLFHHRHAELRIEEFPAFYGLFSFIACTVLVLGARLLRALVQRREDYYGD